MEVILLERVAKLGQMGDVVRVKDGFARNFLLPKGKALRATQANRTKFEGMKVDLEVRNLAAKGEAEKVGSKLDGQSFVVLRQASDTGQLYGSVSPRDLAVLLSQGGFAVDRREGRGETYFALPGAGVLRLSADFKQVTELATAPEMKDTNLHNTAIWFGRDSTGASRSAASGSHDFTISRWANSAAPTASGIDASTFRTHSVRSAAGSGWAEHSAWSSACRSAPSGSRSQSRRTRAADSSTHWRGERRSATRSSMASPSVPVSHFCSFMGVPSARVRKTLA